MFAKLDTVKTVTFGPVLDSDGTPYTGAIAYTDAKIWKNGADGALDESATFTHKFQGFYALALTANDISAVGVAEVTLNKADYTAPAVKLDVLPANVYDSLVAGSDYLDTNVAQIKGSSLTSAAIPSIPYAGSQRHALTITGTVVAGIYWPSGIDGNGHLYYRKFDTTGVVPGGHYLWYDPGVAWKISEVVSVDGDLYWSSATRTGTYTSNTGGFTATVSDLLQTVNASDSVDESAAGAVINAFPIHSGTGRPFVISQPTSGVAGDTHFTFELLDESADGKILEGDSEVIEEAQEDDRIKTTTEYTAAVVGTQRQWTVNVLSHDSAYTKLIGDPAITLSSSDELVATIDASGADHYVGDGTCKIIGESAAIGTSTAQRFEKEITNSNSGGQTTERVTYEPHSGSVRESATDAIDDRVVVEGKEKEIFSTQDHSTPLYVRNTDCWAADLDLMCISPWNSLGGAKRAGTLISPRHVLVAGHYPLTIGTTMRFIDAANNVVDRTIAAVQSLGDDDDPPDFQVCLLNADATGCGYAKALPDDWADYLPNYGRYIPVFGTDQEEKALVRDLWMIGESTLTCNPPTDADRLSFYEDLVLYDSGNPVFMVVNGELVLLSVWTWGGAGSGYAVSSYKSEIEAAMVALGGGYSTLTEIDLSGFNTY